MNKFVTLNKLNTAQRRQYNEAILNAFPKIINCSPIIKKFWSRLEEYFPGHQQYLISSKGQLIGFINTIPFYFLKSMDELPDSGWDWMFEKGITDFENNIDPNYLGGLQVIVRKQFQNLGYSKQILNHAKGIVQDSHLRNLVIPIRPIKKHEFPEIPMSSYINLKSKDKIFDPWIRTHIKSGAQLIKICNKSMTMKGDIAFWETMLGRNITQSGTYQLNGALELITIDLENDTGQYIEPNIWIKY